MAKVEENIEKLIKPIIENLGYELYDVEYVKEGKNFILRIFIDSENGITIEDCEKTNDAINDILDEANYIKESYFLEVSSPGIERVLKKDRHLDKAIGSEVEVNLFKALNNKKTISGILNSYTEENITIVHNSTEISILRKDIAQVKTKYNWDN